jgi:hypothetical protein
LPSSNEVSVAKESHFIQKKLIGRVSVLKETPKCKLLYQELNIGLAKNLELNTST